MESDVLQCPPLSQELIYNEIDEDNLCCTLARNKIVNEHFKYPKRKIQIYLGSPDKRYNENVA